MVRDGVHPTPVTLAIGDGANDVGMIQVWLYVCSYCVGWIMLATRCHALRRIVAQEAHLGVGISGKEGLQESPPLTPENRLARHRAALRRACCKLGS
jgi:hypothetical protein